jgi:hypothetical protein
MKNYFGNVALFCFSFLLFSPLFFLVSELKDREKYKKEKTKLKKKLDSGKGSNVEVNKITSSTETKKQSNKTFTTTSSSVVSTTTTPQNKATTTTKNQVYFKVPFTPQAPTANWSDPRQQNGCEEASILMAMKWVKGEDNLDDKQSVNEIINLTQRAEKLFGDHRDLSASDTNKLIKDYFSYNKTKLEYDVGTKDIINELEAGRVVVAPVDGTVLKNPYYNPPGPKEHMIVIHGFDRENQEFITHDPGTSRGKDFRYSFEKIENSLRDYNTGYHEPISEERTAIISFSK